MPNTKTKPFGSKLGNWKVEGIKYVNICLSPMFFFGDQAHVCIVFNFNTILLDNVIRYSYFATLSTFFFFSLESALNV